MDKSTFFHFIPALLCMASLVFFSQWTFGADNLLANGDFNSIPQTDNALNDWPIANAENGISYQNEKDAGNFLRLQQQKPNTTVAARRKLALPPEIKALKLTVRYRASDIKQGVESWNKGNINTTFSDNEGRTYDSSFKFEHITGDTDGWVEKTSLTRIPDGATDLTIVVALRKTQSGTFDIASVHLEPADAATIPRGPLTHVERDRLAVIKKDGPKPKELFVKGNRLVDAEDNEVWLQGLAIASLEWTAPGHGVLYSSQVAIDDWNANVVRIALKDSFWYGKGKYQKDGGKEYREYVDKIVALVNSRGAYAVIDLHKYRAPKEEDVTFWIDAATRYKNKSGVLFDLLNEPHSVSWDVWRNGGLAEIGRKTDALSENKQTVITEKVLGMQDLINAVRSTGAKNVVIAGGLDWAYDLTGVLNGYALEDKTGNGIVYSTHVYPWKNGWQKRFLDAAEKYPIFMGEVGCMEDRMPFIPPERHESPYTWAPDMLHVIKKYRINWTAWCFHVYASPCVISDWEFTPTPYWGKFVKEALKGKDDWPLKKLR